jgi:hypothetical protein
MVFGGTRGKKIRAIRVNRTNLCVKAAADWVGLALAAEKSDLA